MRKTMHQHMSESVQTKKKTLVERAERYLEEEEAQIVEPSAEQKQAVSVVWTKEDFKDETDEELIGSWHTWADPMPWYMNQVIQGRMESKKFIISDIQSLKNLIDAFLERMSSKGTVKQ